MSDASAALGAPEIAGALVNPKGMAKKVAVNAAAAEISGAFGSVHNPGTVDYANASVPDLPNFGRVGYLGFSEAALVLMKTGGAWTMRPKGDPLAKVPLESVESVSFDENRVVSHLAIRFRDGKIWEFDVPRNGRKAGKQFYDALHLATG